MNGHDRHHTGHGHGPGTEPPAEPGYPEHPEQPHAAGHGQAHAGHGGHDKHEGHSPDMFRRKYWLSLVLTIPTVIWGHMLMRLTGWEAPAFPGSEWIPPLLGTAVFVYGGLVFLKGAWRELQDRLPGMMTLISLAITVAFVFSVAVTLGYEGMALWWELATLVTIMLLGHWMEMRSISQAQGALNELAKLLPGTAERVIDGRTEVVPVGAIGDDGLEPILPGDDPEGFGSRFIAAYLREGAELEGLRGRRPHDVHRTRRPRKQLGHRDASPGQHPEEDDGDVEHAPAALQAGRRRAGSERHAQHGRLVRGIDGRHAGPVPGGVVGGAHGSHVAQVDPLERPGTGRARGGEAHVDGEDEPGPLPPHRRVLPHQRLQPLPISISHVPSSAASTAERWPCASSDWFTEGSNEW